MGARPKIALRPLSEEEQHTLQRVAKASSERVDAVKRAKALLAVAEGKTLTQAGMSAQLSREGVSQLVERFNERGLDVLVIAKGRGRKPTYDAEARGRVLQEVQRPPDREKDQTATWSLKLLEHSLRKADLPPSGRRPLDGSYMRKATVSKRTALGVTRAMRCANARMESTACAIPIPRKKKFD